MIVGICDTTNGISADYIYRLRYDKRTGKITCTCKGFVYDGAKKKCAHAEELLKILKEEGLI
jgi:hypothetical protein